MKVFVVVVLAALASGGCAISKQTFGPDGKEAQSISCSGSWANWGMCEAKAGDICGARGYTVMSGAV